MTHDRPITISSAGSRSSKHWPGQRLLWGDLVARLTTPVRSTETYAEYIALPKPKQDELKDVGGFVCGTLAPERRKAQYLQGRDVITLDLDSIKPGGTQAVMERIDGLGVNYCVYSTRKHCEAAPRLRVLVCLDRTVTADEYEPIARKLGEMIGMEMCDPTTFEGSRLMYYPSCCADAPYVYQYKDAPMLYADGMLALYADWRDTTAWPQVPGNAPNHAKRAKTQGEPTEKPHVIGAFNRVYDIPAAIEAFLPEAYEPCDGLGAEADRYTFTGGSTTGGAVLYDNGKFLYSHHATDPCGGKLVNAFDMVRLHLFGDLDDDADPNAKGNRLPSFVAMTKFAAKDPEVNALMDREQYDRATQVFDVMSVDGVPLVDATQEMDPQRSEWRAKLAKHPMTGKPERTAINVQLMLEGDPKLAGRIKRDTFADRLMGVAPLPWSPRENEKGLFIWKDSDDAGLALYAERQLEFASDKPINNALAQVAERHAYDPVREFLEGVTWDGMRRLDTLFIDYMGAEDCEYVRTVTRKSLVAAVARVMEPGVKFDEMVVLCGPQGTFKSTIIARLGGQWYSDSVISFEGKDGAELIQGVWIVEIGELHAIGRSDLNVVKSFMSRCIDNFRAAYGRRVEPHPRRCVFFGTTNDLEFLQDPTGDRRFLPIIVRKTAPIKSVIEDLTPDVVAQIWAEAYMNWQMSEPLHLSADMTAEAERRRKEHIVRDPMQGMVEDFLNKPIPADWYSLSLEQHRAFWGGRLTGTAPLTERDRVCIAEIMRECFNDTRASLDPREARRVGAILARIPGWERGSTARFGPEYGTQKTFKRCEKA